MTMQVSGDSGADKGMIETNDGVGVSSKSLLDPQRDFVLVRQLAFMVDVLDIAGDAVHSLKKRDMEVVRRVGPWSLCPRANFNDREHYSKSYCIIWGQV